MIDIIGSIFERSFFFTAEGAEGAEEEREEKRA
jgi:hypothetical protein